MLRPDRHRESEAVVLDLTRRDRTRLTRPKPPGDPERGERVKNVVVSGHRTGVRAA